MSDLAERLRAMTQNTGQDHRSGQEFVRGDSQEVVAALREALDRIEQLERENAELVTKLMHSEARAILARRKTIEEAAMVAIKKWKEYQGPFGSQAASTCAYEIEAAIRRLAEQEGTAPVDNRAVNSGESGDN